jgi:pyruvate formate lyase activating enzyme
MIKGITETSFLDWDGKIVMVLYTGNCNFKCPFCHNWELMANPQKFPEKNWEEIKTFLTEHADFLDGVCITGGEPTLEKDLEVWIARIKNLDLRVKLDTNGNIPSALEDLINKNLLDAVAMDIKAPLDERYSVACGTDVDLDAIKRSIKLLRESGLEHEFRTTVVPTIHVKADIIDIAKALSGAEKYALQQFNPENTWEEELRNIDPYPNDVLMEMANAAKEHVKEVRVRGLR